MKCILLLWVAVIHTRATTASEAFSTQTWTGLHVRGGAPSMNYRGPGAPLRPSPLAKSKPSYRRVQGSARLEPTVSRAEAQRGVTLTQRDVSDLSDRDSRVGFIRKVYGILGSQLAVTLGAIVLATRHRAVVAPFLNSPAGGGVAAVASMLSVACALLLGLRPSLQASRGGLFVLALFTLCEALVVALVSSVYSATSVTLAVAQTAAVALVLSLYAWQPSAAHDLSGLGSALGSGLVVLSLAAVLTRVFGFGGGEVAVSSAAALLFGGFIVFDTKRICEGTHPHYSLRSHQYIAGAMALYTDIISLFFHLLRLFGERDKERR